MPRIPTLDPQQATGKSQELLASVQKKLGMTPNLMRTMANSPAALNAYLQFGQALGEGVLSAKTREQIALAVAQHNSCEYCLRAHSAVGKMVGLTVEQVQAARRGEADHPKTRAILQLATQLVERRGWLSDEEINAARNADVSDVEIAEVIANTAYNLYSNYFNHVANTKVDFPPLEPMEMATTGETCSSGGCHA